MQPSDGPDTKHGPGTEMTYSLAITDLAGGDIHSKIRLLLAAGDYSDTINTKMTNRIWSEEQLPIFNEFQNGRCHFVVEARAGTGKTTTIEHGISLAPEDKKVYLAFNKKNVLEAKAKIKDPNCQIMSLNGLGYRFVCANWKGVVADDEVEFDRIKDAINSDRNLKKLQYPPLGVIRDIVAYAKNTKPFANINDLVAMAMAKGFEPDDKQENRGWTTQIFCNIALASMNAAKTLDKKNRISFNDQLWLPIVMKWVRPWFNMVVVDECQDMNPVQLLLAQRSCKPSGRIVLVGDPRQAIYGFRGADVNGMERLKTELRAKTFPLTTTYRCASSIVDLAKTLVPDYQAAPTAPAGSITELPIIKITEHAVSGDAIISRTNAPLMRLCLSFLKKGVRAYIEGRDVGSSLLNIHKRFENVSNCVEYIFATQAWAEDRIRKVVGEPASDTFKAAVSLIADQAETLTALAEESSTPAEVALRLSSLFADSDKEVSGRAIVLSSVHKAKGLEWNRVFLVKETFKHCNWTSVVSENNNIAYVAVTRAKTSLVWLTPEVTLDQGIK